MQGLTETLATRGLTELEADPLANPELLSALLSHADKLVRLRPAALARVPSFTRLLLLAANILSRSRAAETLDAAMGLLCTVGIAARAPTWLPNAPILRSEPTASAVRAGLSREVGEAVMRGAIIGLADTLPEVMPAVHTLAAHACCAHACCARLLCTLATHTCCARILCTHPL